MAEYNGVHVARYKVRGVMYVKLWWYVGQGSKRASLSLGRSKGWTKARLSKARLSQEKELALQPGRVGAGEAPTLKAWVEQWKANRSDLSKTSLRLVDRTVRMMEDFEHHGARPFDPDRRIDRITRAEAAAWRAWLSKRTVPNDPDELVSEATVCKYIRCASSLFGTRTGAASVDLIPFNPFDRLKKNAQTETKGHPTLTAQQEQSLLDACPSAEWRSLVALVLYAGLRIGETALVEWSDVKWGEGKLSVPKYKTRRRDCLMLPELEAVLLEGFDLSEGGRVVPLSRSNLNREMTKIIKRSGVEVWPEVFQALRRRRDVMWKQQYPEFIVDSWLGHSGQVSRDHYLTVPEDVYESAQHRRNMEPAKEKP